MEKPENNKMLFQPNALIEAKYSLTNHQNNIVLMALGMAYTDIIHKQDDGITFDIEKLYNLTKTGLRQDRYILAIKKALQGLQKETFTIIDPVTKDWQTHTWLPSMKGNLESHKVTLYFNQRLLDLFNQRIENGNFTKIFLKNVLPLKTSYAKKIYQIAMQYRPPLEIPEIDINEFRQILGLKDKYATYKALNRDLIKPVLADINKQTDITIKMIPKRTGKTISHIKFKYKFKSLDKKAEYNKPNKQKSFCRKKPTKQEINNLTKAEQITAELLKTGGIQYK